MRQKVFTFLILFLNVAFGLAQSSTPGGSVRLTVLTGSNIEFVFNSIAKYSAGITLTNWTVLGISVTDNPGDNNAPPAVDDYTTWRLYAEALDSDGDGGITGSGVPIPNQIPFSTIELSASVSLGCGTCVVPIPGFFALPAPGMGVLFPLMDGSGGGADQIDDVPSADNLDYTTDQVAISYQCGVTTPLINTNTPADYYSDDIVFTLEMNP